MRNLMIAWLWTSPVLASLCCYCYAHWCGRACWHWGDVGMVLHGIIYGVLLTAFLCGMARDEERRERRRDLLAGAWLDEEHPR